MARFCSVCGEKIPFGTDVYNCEGHEICLSCNMHTRYLVNDKYFTLYEVSKISDSFDVILDHIKQGHTNNDLGEKLLQMINEKNQGFETFQAFQDSIKEQFPKEECVIFDGYLALNEKTQKLSVMRNDKYFKPHSFSELLDYEVIEDGNSVISGRAGAATVGMLLGGVTGAVIGSSMKKKQNKMVQNLEILLTFEGLDTPIEHIVLINREVAKDSKEYKEKIEICNQIVSALKQIINPTKKTEDNAETSRERGKSVAIYAFSVADEILKFKQLADDGIITESEFEDQKRKLLELEY